MKNWSKKNRKNGGDDKVLIYLYIHGGFSMAKKRAGLIIRHQRVGGLGEKLGKREQLGTLIIYHIRLL